jgi:O-acetyl-ADP-ribose deacetylase (regulator of RNase III)
VIFYKKGDLFKAPEQLLAHGVNCSGAFGSGVAAGMALNHIVARNSYFFKYTEFGWELGDVQFIVSNNKWIANCATQLNYLPRTMCHADYPAIEAAMLKVKEFAMKDGLTVAMPKIGAGLAGGDWNIIKAILEKVFNDYDATVYELLTVK